MNICKKASDWLKEFSNPDSAMINYLKTLYGENEDFVFEKAKTYTGVLEAFIERYGDKEVIISRAPGRVNLMGRHIEHRGGNINTIAIHKETIMVASCRNDDTVNISNTDDRFSDYSFSILKERQISDASIWIDYIDSREVKDAVAYNRGHWSNYVKGATLRLAFEYENAVTGMDIMCCGDVPLAGGVSSSSSIVVATAELSCAINNLSVEREKFISLCGQGEWYVGSRGGSGDHAAIKCGEPGCITPIEFEPINVLESVKIPEGFSVIVANSFIEAKKSEGAKDRFNQMVAAYEFGVMLVLKEFPQYLSKIKHLRDINPDNLEVDETQIYKILLSVPMWLKSEELFDKIPQEYHEKVRRIISSHAAPEAYNIRSALFYGITECERSRKASLLLKNGDIKSFAQIMNISHCGDRVAYLSEGKTVDYDYLLTDEKLEELIEKSNNSNPDALLYKQPGGYGCSVAQIDILIDKLLGENGVLGAQISGAGLGGCIMILCEKEYEDNILQYLNTNYYKPNGFPNGAIIIKPVKGSMCLEF